MRLRDHQGARVAGGRQCIIIAPPQLPSRQKNKCADAPGARLHVEESMGFPKVGSTHECAITSVCGTGRHKIAIPSDPNFLKRR